jgi:hypothetical protein
LGQQFERAVDRGAASLRVDRLGVGQDLVGIQMLAFALDDFEHGKARGRDLVAGGAQLANQRGRHSRSIPSREQDDQFDARCTRRWKFLSGALCKVRYNGVNQIVLDQMTL